ncbi:hypothetical protein Tco_0580409 [Tanacetum coccineum]
MSITIQSSVKDKILATPSETSKVENAPAEMLRNLDQQMEKRADDGGKANVVTDALSRKERVKPRRVRAMAMGYSVWSKGNDIDSLKGRMMMKRWGVEDDDRGMHCMMIPSVVGGADLPPSLRVGGEGDRGVGESDYRDGV